MKKLRKMLGDITSPECVTLMRLMESQSHATLAAWATSYAEQRYLPLLAAEQPIHATLSETIAQCKSYLAGEIKLVALKPSLREARTVAAKSEAPASQAAARAVATSCATVQTPTNAFGFLLYGAAAVAYHNAGLDQSQETYDALATEELQYALTSLESVAVPHEPNPAKINWNC